MGNTIYVIDQTHQQEESLSIVLIDAEEVDYVRKCVKQKLYESNQTLCMY